VPPRTKPSYSSHRNRREKVDIFFSEIRCRRLKKLKLKKDRRGVSSRRCRTRTANEPAGRVGAAVGIMPVARSCAGSGEHVPPSIKAFPGENGPMTAVSSTPRPQRLVLHGVSWREYTRMRGSGQALDGTSAAGAVKQWTAATASAYCRATATAPLAEYGCLNVNGGRRRKMLDTGPFVRYTYPPVSTGSACRVAAGGEEGKRCESVAGPPL
jgi:hypothetical protein